MSAKRQSLTTLWLLLCVLTLSATAQTPSNSSASGPTRATPATAAAPDADLPTTTTADRATAETDSNAPSDASPSVGNPSTPAPPTASANAPSGTTRTPDPSAELTTTTSDTSEPVTGETPTSPTTPATTPSTRTPPTTPPATRTTPSTTTPTATPAPATPVAPVAPAAGASGSSPLLPLGPVDGAASTPADSSPALDPSEISSVYGTLPPSVEGGAPADNSDRESNASATSPGWVVPVVVAAVVLLALLVITFYVRTRKREEPDNLDRPSEHFFEAPRSNTNYANAAGGTGSAAGGATPVIRGRMTADERAQKEAALAMRKPSGALAVAPTSGPPKMPTRTLSHPRQEPVRALVEPQFTLQEEVELERSQRSMHVASARRSPQAAVSPVSQSYEMDPSFDMAAGASVPGVTL
ncbi:unnamed protein product [Hyaloperonospora brassicae]|uniref:RxLR effector candidate protein n=1 Tax=Hyaloperonospora brassicae TaxID=162125 RepID=A0AAV0V189_HYABA|nr:unnamed protein product [Hyaloperonospora brassicae]